MSNLAFLQFVLGVLDDSVASMYKSGGPNLDRPLSGGNRTYYTKESEWPLTQPIPKLEASIQVRAQLVIIATPIYFTRATCLNRRMFVSSVFRWSRVLGRPRTLTRPALCCFCPQYCRLCYYKQNWRLGGHGNYKPSLHYNRHVKRSFQGVLFHLVESSGRTSGPDFKGCAGCQQLCSRSFLFLLAGRGNFSIYFLQLSSLRTHDPILRVLFRSSPARTYITMDSLLLSCWLLQNTSRRRPPTWWKSNTQTSRSQSWPFKMRSERSRFGLMTCPRLSSPAMLKVPWGITRS